MKKTICFDIDGVICKISHGKYHKAIPIKKNIAFINSLYKRGFRIIIFTARFMGRTKDNVNLAKKKAEKITLKQLVKWNVNYHKIFFGKPSYDYFVDDKSIFFDKNWTKKLNTLIKKKL